MRAYIKKLQSKKEHVRKQILIGSMIASMIVMTFVWVYSLGYRFNKEVVVKVEEDIKPFAVFKNSVSDAYQNISASVGNISAATKLIDQEDEFSSKDQIDLIPVE